MGILLVEQSYHTSVAQTSQKAKVRKLLNMTYQNNI